MMRKMLGGMFLVFFGLSLSVAAETISQASVKAIDYEKNSITVTVADRDQSYLIDKDAEILAQVFTPNGLEMVPSKLTAIQAGNTVTLTVEKINNRDMVSTVLIAPDVRLGKRFPDPRK